jgi:regulator of nucleoside diphosphate kinase
MDAVNPRERRLTELDFSRLKALSVAGGANPLAQVLGQAQVVDTAHAAGNLVTMYARVDLEDGTTRRHHQFVLCYPGHPEPRPGHISVLSPVGLALIGLQVGATASWDSPAGQRCQARVIAVSRAARSAA